jgi:hypothetical protein
MPRNLPARYPPGPWPGQMRADMVAAFLDFENTADLAAAVSRGEAPRPSALRKKCGKSNRFGHAFTWSAFLRRQSSR